MEDNRLLDIRAANFLIRKLSSYVYRKGQRRKAAAEKEWLLNFKGKDFIIHPLEEGLNIKLYNDSVLSKLIFEGFETDEIVFLNTFLDPGDTFIDIGANVGLFSLYASKKVGPQGSVIAFEPSSATSQRLLENIQLNGLKNISVFKLGLSDKSEILELNISINGYEAWNTFVKSADDKFSRTEKVQVKSFDDFCRENAFSTDKVALIKLDVEGFEINVLKGASGLLSKEEAPVFMVEYTDDNALAAGHCCHEIYKLLNSYGYEWYAFNAIDGKLTYEPMRLNYPYKNLIAIKDIKSSRAVSKFNIEY